MSVDDLYTSVVAGDHQLPNLSTAKIKLNCHAITELYNIHTAT